MTRLIPPKVAGDVLMYRDISKGRGFWHWSLHILAFHKYLPDRVIVYGIPNNITLTEELLNTRVCFNMVLSKIPNKEVKLKLVVAYPSYKGAYALDRSTYSYVTKNRKEGMNLFRTIQKRIMSQQSSFEGLKDVAAHDMPRLFANLGRAGVPKKTDRISRDLFKVRGRSKGKR